MGVHSSSNIPDTLLFEPGLGYSREEGHDEDA